MNLKERAKRDIERITANTNEWAEEITLIAPNDTPQLVVTGLFTKHSLGVDAQLQKWANVPNAHVSISEQLLVDGEYPYVLSSGEISFHNHKVSVVDSSGQTYIYRIEQWFPNRTVGLITCILGEYQNE